ncbi:hypothetical protein [uncultured Sunxiuqinia sp.]|uniref:hypothetical protein n=1 Tax=Sunxiuqinia rutila TaxID=1397841 RepID=UPI0026044C68|nr:hypothetical protein [uncultured Sunxiuqinia sp.]
MKKIKLFLIIAVLGLAISACEYDFIAQEELPDIPVDEDVSFSEVILPIFTSRCAECHQAGGQAPDLTADKAYQSINTAKYIDTANPESSLIYSYVAPGASTHGHRQYTAAQAQFVLVWIQQGAMNN